MSAEVAVTSCLRRSCVDGSCATVGNDMPKDTSNYLWSSLNKASRLLHPFFIMERLSSTPNTGTSRLFASTDQQIVMTHSGKHVGNSPGKSSHDSHDVASHYHQTDGPSLNEQIRRRAFELYVEHGRQPGDGVADWLQAEREFHKRS